MRKTEITRAPKVFPSNIREAIEIAATICRRIAEKRLDKPQNDALIKAVQDQNGGTNENR